MLNHKRILSLVLAGAMAASLAVPAFAAEEAESTTNTQLKIDGTYQAVTIAVVVPSAGTVIVDPYSLPVEIGTDASNKAIKVDGQQIVTKPVAIKNQSDINLDINVTATPTVKGSLTLTTAPIEDVTKETKNTAFLYLDVESSTVSGASSAVTAAAIATAWKGTTWTEYSTGDNAPTNILALTKSGTAFKGEKIGTLTKATMNDSTGAFSEYAAGSIAFVNLRGQCAQNPTTAWTTKDGVSVVVAFTFTPSATASGSNSNNNSDT
jgi:hypothetical protein